MTLTEISSSPILDLGLVPDDINSRLEQAAQAAMVHPSYSEAGRSSDKVTFTEGEENDSHLHDLARDLSEIYLGIIPAIGSTAVISIIHDAVEFNNSTRNSKVASYWHQDFVVNNDGFAFPPDTRTRIVIPMQAGPLCITGHLKVVDAIRLETGALSGMPKSSVINLGATLIGADNVLVKSETDPLEGEVYEAKPDRVYIIPGDAAHMTNPVLPQGRILFTLDVLHDIA